MTSSCSKTPNIFVVSLMYTVFFLDFFPFPHNAVTALFFFFFVFFQVPFLLCSMALTRVCGLKVSRSSRSNTTPKPLRARPTAITCSNGSSGWWSPFPDAFLSFLRHSRAGGNPFWFNIWTPSFAGMMKWGAGMTKRCAGMTETEMGMTGLLGAWWICPN